MKKELLNITRLLKDEKASPLIEEGLLIGLSLIIIAIIVGIVLRTMGWTQDIFNSILEQLEEIKKSISQMFS